jgi:hypothetical protein
VEETVQPEPLTFEPLGPVPDYLGWTVQIEEFAPGGYQLDAVHLDGRSIIRTGTDPDFMLKGFKADVVAMQGKRPGITIDTQM